METWIVCDRSALVAHYGPNVQPTALPPTNALELRARTAVLQSLTQSTRSAPRPYAKGAESFVLLARLDAQVLARHLPSFARLTSVLNQEL